MGTTYIGKGKIYGGLKSGGQKRLFGNVSRWAPSIQTERKELADFTSAGGGSQNTLERVTGMTAEMVLHDLSPENIALVTRGSSSAVAGAAQTSEAHTAYQDGLTNTNFPLDIGQTVTVTGTGGTPTYVEGTDYTISPAGIFVLASGSIGDASDIELSYQSLGVSAIELLTSAADELELVFDGLNEAESGNPVIITVHRAKFGVAQEIEFIADEFGALTVSHDLLKDETITTGGVSQFAKIEMVVT